MKKVQIDARGKNCPEPVSMTNNAISPDVTELETIVDNPVARENVSRFMKSKGFRVECMEKDGIITVRGWSEIGTDTAMNGIAKPDKAYAVLITHPFIGGEDKELGHVLMMACLSSLGQITIAPSAIILMNGGVKLATAGTSSCEHLEALTAKGVKILVCGTCLKHFDLLDSIGTGQVSNMFEITECLAAAGHVVSL